VEPKQPDICSSNFIRCTQEALGLYQLLPRNLQKKMAELAIRGQEQKPEYEGIDSVEIHLCEGTEWAKGFAVLNHHSFPDRGLGENMVRSPLFETSLLLQMRVPSSPERCCSGDFRSRQIAFSDVAQVPCLRSRCGWAKDRLYLEEGHTGA